MSFAVDIVLVALCNHLLRLEGFCFVTTEYQELGLLGMHLVISPHHRLSSEQQPVPSDSCK